MTVPQRATSPVHNKKQVVNVTEVNSHEKNVHNKQRT